MANPHNIARNSRETFLQNLVDSGILADEDLLQVLASGPAALDGPALARQVVAAGKLSRFQADAILEGRITDIVVGNYVLLDRLGEGGMGTVYKARHRRMKRVVAIKFLSRQMAKDESFVQRFQREVEILAGLIHPNIVLAFDADEAPAGPYLVMEFVNGQDLDTQVVKHGPLAVADAVNYLAQAARGLAYAHAQGMVHRDIKPANLLLDASSVVKVVDLGLARFTGPLAKPAKMALTQAGIVVGTVEYMAPEQAEDSTTIDHRADIYSLGCTLYFLLTGRLPYDGPTLIATIILHRDATIPPLRSACPAAPPPLEALFRRMVAKNVEDRPASMEEVVRELEAIAALLRSPAGRAAFTEWPADDPTRPGAPGPTRLQPALKAPPPAGPGPTVAQPGVAPAPATRVLLVEPSPTQAAIVRRHLSALRVAEVQCATSAAQALDLLRTEPPDAVISAMYLNERTALQFAQDLRALPQLADTCLVVISSATDSSEAVQLRAVRGTTLLPKPFDQAALGVALREARLALRGRRPEKMTDDE